MLTPKKAFVFIEDDPAGGAIYTIDVIQHDGVWWLVPYWLDNLAERWRMPERIIRLDAFRHQATRNHPEVDFVLNEPIPRSWLYGPSPPTEALPGTVVFQPAGFRLPLPDSPSS